MALPSTTPAVFLDRDGTLIEDRGHLRSPSEVVFFPNTVRALQLLQRSFKLFIVTNQTGIAEGSITPLDVARVHDFIVEHLGRFGVHIEQVYSCPHRRSDGCHCIKPNPYFLQEASRAYGIDLRRSFVIGDHPHDVELGRKVGAVGIYVLTGHGEKHRAELSADVRVVSDIWEAAKLAIRMNGSNKNPRDLEKEITRAADILRQGGVVAFPTETVYGLGANAFDTQAVVRVFEIKRRPRFDPLIVHVADLYQAEDLVSAFPEQARELAQHFWPGPLTLVLPKNERVPDIVTAGLSTIAVRMPDHPVALAMICEAKVPVAAPSANRFGCVSPTTADHVRRHLGDDVDVVLDGGPCRLGIESTIISVTEEQPMVLRLGSLPSEEIKRIIGQPLRTDPCRERPRAPGQLPRHYATQTPLVLRENVERLPRTVRAGLLSFRVPAKREGFAAVEVLSPEGDLREAAANLFAALHRLDAMNLDVIVADRVPDTGLGPAINDRLCRAAQGAAGMADGHRPA